VKRRRAQPSFPSIGLVDSKQRNIPGFRRAANLIASAKQIQAITGHKSLEEVERYTWKADQMRLARQAVAKQENHNGS
jgi:integrase